MRIIEKDLIYKQNKKRYKIMKKRRLNYLNNKMENMKKKIIYEKIKNKKME